MSCRGRGGIGTAVQSGTLRKVDREVCRVGNSSTHGPGGLSSRAGLTVRSLNSPSTRSAAGSHASHMPLSTSRSASLTAWAIACRSDPAGGQLEPRVLIVPHEGVLELTLINDDKNTHCAVLPSNGDTQFIWLVNHSKGTATLELDGPGNDRYGPDDR